jgi:hypothetical protein
MCYVISLHEDMVTPNKKKGMLRSMTKKREKNKGDSYVQKKI